MYTSASVKQAYKKSKLQLYQEIGIIYPGLASWTKEELVSAWLEGYGQRTDETWTEPSGLLAEAVR